jgi:hypothetical protein
VRARRPAAAAGDVLSSSTALPNGACVISANGALGWGTLAFTQACPPCTPGGGKKGKKGCMKKK